MKKKQIWELVDSQEEELFSMACQIFDKPEWDGGEQFAAGLLSEALKERGFSVTMGVGGLETAFRAVWSNGTGGLNIGILGEYDALRNGEHACGHHLQTPAAIGAAVAVKKVFEGTDTPCTITIYGTPAEETFGGKILMVENGCFEELDIALASHATRTDAFVGGSSMALDAYKITYKGKSAHAAGAPWEGRSAADAMFLSFNGIEYMREHVKDGTRIHYTVREALPPSNMVPDRAVGGYTLRSPDNEYLQQINEWFCQIIQGACMMTQTQAELNRQPHFAARKKNQVLAQLAKDNFEQLGIKPNVELIKDSKGSTDFGNVSCLIPGALIYLPYVDAVGHSQEWIDAGKTDIARKCMRDSARVLAGMIYDLIIDPSLARCAKEEFDRAYSC